MTGQERLAALARHINIPLDSLNRFKTETEEILEFVAGIDKRLHDLTDGTKIDPFFGDTLHRHISSDLRALIVLASTDNNYQLNIILRHFVEVFVFTLWADLASQFRGSFDYILDTREWKPYRSVQRVTWDFDKNFPNRSINERLERLRLINMLPEEGKAFYQKYFSSASSCDLILLLSLPICEKCMKTRKDQVNYREFHLDPQIRRAGKEDKHAVYKTDFGFVCCFCNMQKLTQGFAWGIPEAPEMLDMLVSILEDELAVNLRMLQKVYNYLSEEFVHFSTTNHPDSKPASFDIGSKKAVFWGFESVLVCIEILKPLMNHYFTKLEQVKSRLGPQIVRCPPQLH
jgi:hypothetical protein